MKQIIFKNTKTVDNVSIEMFRKLVIEFLKNYMSEASADKMITIDKNKVKISPNCANSNYTKGLALLQLIFSDNTDDGYIEYRPYNKGFLINSVNSNWKNLYNHLKQHFNIEIIE